MASHNIDKEQKIREMNFYLRCMKLKLGEIGDIYNLKQKLDVNNDITQQKTNGATDLYRYPPSYDEPNNFMYNYNTYSSYDYDAPSAGASNIYDTCFYGENRFYKPFDMENICSHCGAIRTSLWRKLHGKIVCNACGLYFKMHNQIRPQSMRKNFIRKRNRNKRY